MIKIEDLKDELTKVNRKIENIRFTRGEDASIGSLLIENKLYTSMNNYFRSIASNIILEQRLDENLPKIIKCIKYELVSSYTPKVIELKERMKRLEPAYKKYKALGKKDQLKDVRVALGMNTPESLYELYNFQYEEYEKITKELQKATKKEYYIEKHKDNALKEKKELSIDIIKSLFIYAQKELPKKAKDKNFIEQFYKNGKVNRPLVNLSLSFLGEGNLYNVIKKIEDTQAELNLIEDTIDLISSLRDNVDYIVVENTKAKRYQEEINKLDEEIEKYKKYQSELVNKKEGKNIREQVEINSAINSVKRKIKELNNGRANALNRLSEVPYIRNQKIEEINKTLKMFTKCSVEDTTNLNRTFSRIDYAELDNKEQLALEYYISEEKIEKYKSYLTKKAQSLNLEIEKTKAGLSSEHKNLKTSMVSDLKEINESYNKEPKRIFLLGLSMLQLIDNVDKDKSLASTILNQNEKKKLESMHDRSLLSDMSQLVDKFPLLKYSDDAIDFDEQERNMIF